MAATELAKTVLKDNPNLKAYYRFESGALTTDSSGNGYTLTNNNSVGEGLGVFGGGADTSAANSHLTASSNLGITTGSISISLWWKQGSEIGSGLKCLAFHGNNTNKVFYEIYYDYNAGSRRIMFRRYKSGVGPDATYYTVTLGTTWHHFVLTYDGTTLRGYLDGAMVTNTAASGAGSIVISDAIDIGVNLNGSDYGVGVYDDVAYFSSALSADQVKELYEGRMLGELWPQSGLVGLWHFNGNSTDSSGSNIVPTNGTVTYPTGIFGSCVDFAGTNGNYISLGTNTTLNITGNFSIVCWVNPDVVNRAPQFIYAKDDTVTRGFGFGLSNTELYLEKEGSILLTSSGAGMTAGVWTHIAATFNGSTWKLFKNGNVVASIAGTAIPSAASVIALFGRRQYAGAESPFDGKVDELAIYNRSLSDLEIRNFYAWSTGKY